MSINRVILTGNLTRDPEMRANTSGFSVLGFGLAVNDRRKDANGNWVDSPNFVDCVVFGKRADSLKNMIHKGTKVAIEGKLRYSSWQDNQGNKRSKLEVIVDDLEFMAPKNAATPEQPSAEYPTY